jgi:uncharacterized membrane protein YhaH (DUF805 family)
MIRNNANYMLSGLVTGTPSNLVDRLIAGLRSLHSRQRRLTAKNITRMGLKDKRLMETLLAAYRAEQDPFAKNEQHYALVSLGMLLHEEAQGDSASPAREVLQRPPSGDDPGMTASARNTGSRIFALSGHAGRLEYFAIQALLLGVLGMVWALRQMVEGLSGASPGSLTTPLSTALAAAWLIATIPVTVRRLHDLRLRNAPVLLMLLPAVNLCLVAVLLLVPSARHRPPGACRS